MKKLKPVTRILLAVSALLMVINYFVPVWQILMWAPQYPEGLEMKIWLNTISGDYKIISGLNHYIGMKHIEVEMFPEFKYMGYIVGVLILAGLASALVNRKFLVYVYTGMILFAGVAGMVDFYQWGYEYGHNLDPTAPIIVPGMAYQPPLIGTKQLLNFTAFSGPDIGGYIFLVSGLLAVASVVLEVYKRKVATIAAAMMVTLLFGTSCSVEPEPIAYGKDGCHSCKMTLMDKKFGYEIGTKKGRIFKFDDVNCMNRFSKSGEVSPDDIAFIMVTDFSNPGVLIPAESALYVKSEMIKSPMGSKIAGFATAESVEQTNAAWLDSIGTWKEVSGVKRD